MILLHASGSRKSEELTEDQEKKIILFSPLPLLSLEKRSKKRKNDTGSF